MKKILYMASFLPILAALACGNAQKNAGEAAESSEPTPQVEAEEQVLNAAPATEDIDWKVLMPEIVKNLPNEVVYKRFQGKIGPDSVDLGGYWGYPYDENVYYLVADDGEEHYLFSAMAVPYEGTEDVLVVANSEGGVDGLGSLLLKSVRYNTKNKKFSDISDKIPGVEPKVELLDLSWLSEHPDWIQTIKNTYDCHISYSISQMDGESKVVVYFSDEDVCLDIDAEMYSTVPDWNDRLSLTYVWDGKTFKLRKKE